MPRIDNDTVTFLQTNINADSKVSHLPDIFPSAQSRLMYDCAARCYDEYEW